MRQLSVPAHAQDIREQVRARYALDHFFTEESCIPAKQALPGGEETPSIGATVAPNVIRSGETINIDLTADAVTGAGDETVRVSVADLLGRVVHARTVDGVSSGDMTVPTEGWSAGSYIVEIALGGESRSFRVVVTD